MGHIIPAGTGFDYHRKVAVEAAGGDCRRKSQLPLVEASRWQRKL